MFERVDRVGSLVFQVSSSVGTNGVKRRKA